MDDDFTILLRFRFPESRGLTHDAPSLGIPADTGRPVLLGAVRKSEGVGKSRELFLKSSGWPTAEAAYAAAERYRDALSIAMARLRLAADFGDQAPSSFMTQHVIERLKEQGLPPHINDHLGIHVYPSSPPPMLIMGGISVLGISMPAERLGAGFCRALELSVSFTAHERLAFDLYTASFFARSADERFLDLMMSVETLIEQRPSSPRAVELVDDLVALTEKSELEESERNSILGRLRDLKRESIRTAGRRLMVERLPDREYQGLSADDFFDECYGLRSQLSHGHAPRPRRGDIGSAAASLEVLVSDLLAGPLVDWEP
jgi:hypothetical protein